MALFKILKGSSSGLKDQAIREGYCYVTTDEKKMYIDISDKERICLNADDSKHAETADSATSASKLTTDAGDTTTPVYFSGGVPTACTMIKSGAWHGGLTGVSSDGVMEIGRYIDFHVDKTGTSDYDVRITASTTGLSIGGTTSGTFKGSLDGNAKTATSATNDSDGNKISTTYVKKSGDTMTGKLRLGKSAQSGMTNAVGLHVHDLRSATITADTFGDHSVNFIFDNRLGTSDWRSAIQVKGWTGGYAAWQLSGGASTAASNKLYYREGVGSSWGTWYSIPFENRANTFTSLNKFTGNVEISNLLTVATGNSHYGIKLGSTYLNAIGDQVIFQNNNGIRFGTDDWDWNCWAGLKYVHSSKYIYLGLADGSVFNANSGQSGGRILTPGISYFHVGNQTGYYFASSGNIYGHEIYSDSWFRSYNTNGWYNETYGCHIRPHDGNYGSIRIHGNARNGYEGIHFGTSTNGMTIMSTPGSH